MIIFRKYFLITIVMFLAGCGGGPNESDIKKALTEDYYSGPTVKSVNLNKCKEISDEIAWVCNFKVSYSNGKASNYDAKFIENSDGWKYKGRI